MARARRWLLALAALAAAGCGEPASEAPSAPATVPAAEEASGVHLEGSRLVNRDGNYSFDMPTGWTLSDGAQPTAVIVEKPGAETAFAVVVTPAVADAAAELAALERSLLAAPVGYAVLEKTERTIGGRNARGLVTTVIIDGKPRITHNFVIVADELTYTLGYEAPRSADEQVTLAPELESILASLRFGDAG